MRYIPLGDEDEARTAAGKRSNHHRTDKSAKVNRDARSNGLQGAFINELTADSRGIGFAYGGIHPGRLHAHGRLFETHKVYYSIGLVGSYELHVGLREKRMALPGSPFTLEVGRTHQSLANAHAAAS